MPFFTAAGVRLHYETYGRGRPVVLLHGFTSSFANNWVRRGWVDLLVGSGFRVVGLDFRSHGDSDRLYDERVVTTYALAADVVALLDYLDIRRAAVFGFSMGGGVALKLAIDQPARIDRVAVCGVGDAALNRLHDPQQIAEILAAFEAQALGEILSPSAKAIRRGADLGGNDLAALAAFLRTGGWPGGLDNELPVRAPVLLVVAADDQYMGGVDELSRWLRHARVKRVPGRDHYTVLDDDEIRASVVAFLRGG